MMPLRNNTKMSAVFCLVGACLLAAPLSVKGQAPAARSENQFSPQTLQALVVGVAFYPDEVVSTILQAAQSPADIRRAVDAQTTLEHQPLPQSIVELQRYPGILEQLNAHLSVTAQLGVAARTQINDVWLAVDAVRVSYAASLQQANAEEDVYQDAAASGGYGNTGGYGSTGVVVAPVGAYAAYAAGLYSHGVVDEYVGGAQATLYGQGVYVQGANGQAAVATYNNGQTAAVVGGGQATVVGPNGGSVSASGAGAAAATQQGNTTYFGAAGAGEVSTSNGAYAAGARTTTGDVTQNADGSTSFNKNTSTQTQSNSGSSNITRDSSGTLDGNGGGEYQATTNVNSTYGDATVATQAGNGQSTTTVSTDNGSQSFTLGDQSVGNQSAGGQSAGGQSAGGQSAGGAARTTGANASSRSGNPFARTNTGGAANRQFGQITPGQIAAGNAALSQSWSQLEQRARKASGQRAGKARGSAQNRFARPSQAGGAGFAKPSSSSFTRPSSSSRSRTTQAAPRQSPSRSSGGRSGGGRSRGGRSGGGRSGGGRSGGRRR